MDATSRRICLTGVLKMNSSRFLFLHSPHSPSSLFSFIRAQLSPPLLSSTREETNGRTVTALVNDIDRHCLPGSSRCVNEKRFFSTSNAPIVLFPFLVSPPPPIFFLLFLRLERLERKLERLRGKMAPRDGNCYLHPLILK